MKPGNESFFYVAAGPLAALLLGLALVPLRGLTPASNLSFAFMALTIVVAELGGRWAAMATALVSALSLDFFLTQPYLRLVIEDNHDVIAFLGLGVCGLIAASLASRRGDRIAALRQVETHRDLLRVALRDWNAATDAGPQLARALRSARDAFPLAAAVIRNGRDRVVASAEPSDALRPVPEDVLQPDTLVPAGGGGKALGWGLPLSDEGGRIALTVGSRPLGWLDVWGDGRPASAESRRSLSDFARLAAVLLAAAGPEPRGASDVEY